MYRIFRERASKKVAGEHLLDFLHEYAKVHRFEVPIDPHILAKLVHPHCGGLLRLGAWVELEELVGMLETCLVASLERAQGQTLLAEEVCSYAFWSHRDTNRHGFLAPADFLRLLRQFGVEADLVRDLGVAAGAELLPFDLFRRVYLERNL